MRVFTEMFVSELLLSMCVLLEFDVRKYPELHKDELNKDKLHKDKLHEGLACCATIHEYIGWCTQQVDDLCTRHITEELPYEISLEMQHNYYLDLVKVFPFLRCVTYPHDVVQKYIQLLQLVIDTREFEEAEDADAEMGQAARATEKDAEDADAEDADAEMGQPARATEKEAEMSQTARATEMGQPARITISLLPSYIEVPYVYPQ